jgi:zinc transporter
LEVRVFVLAARRLQERPSVGSCSRDLLHELGPCWIDIAAGERQEIEALLAPLDLPAVFRERILNKTTDSGVASSGAGILTEYPAAFDRESNAIAFISLLLYPASLVTVRHGHIPVLDGLIAELTGDGAPPIDRLSQVVYRMLDEFADLNAQAQTVARDETQALTKALAEDPASVGAERLARLRLQVGFLVALIEDQLYCITGLKALDAEALRDPHRQAYLDDLISEAEIAQRGVYRLESRLKDLYGDYQVVANDRVERRLRLLTIVSAITLPLGLVTGLLGMNVGGIPGTSVWWGFLAVVILMVVIFLAEFWYFRRKGWFD